MPEHLPNEGAFVNALFEAYLNADAKNRGKLEATWHGLPDLMLAYRIHPPQDILVDGETMAPNGGPY